MGGRGKVVIPHLVGFDSIDHNFRSANKLMHLEYLADNVEYEATRGRLQAAYAKWRAPAGVGA